MKETRKESVDRKRGEEREWRLDEEREDKQERKRKGKGREQKPSYTSKSNPFQRLSYASDSGQEQAQIKESNYPTSKKICVIFIHPFARPASTIGAGARWSPHPKKLRLSRSYLL